MSNTSTISNSDLTGPNHLKIVPVSGVIFKNISNQKTGNEYYKNKNGRMTYKEYISLRKKYMGTEPNNDSNIQNNTMYNIYPKDEEEKKQPVYIKNEEKNNKFRSKSKHDKIKNYYLGGDTKEYKIIEETKGYKNPYETNLDENGNEVLNENLFKNNQIEYKTMRKTYTGKFLPNRKKDIKRETMFNFNAKYNRNVGLDFNNRAHKSYYGGFRKNNDNLLNGKK